MADDLKRRGTMKLEMLSKHPEERRHLTPVLFIHGMFHGAWCWDVHFLDYFTQHGFTAYAVNLRGHGESEGRGRLRWTRIAEYVDDVANAVRQLPCRPILIGHSMGGFVVQVKTPLLILGAARDSMLKPSEIEATARAYRTQSEIIPDVAHNSMLELRWRSVSERIVVWLKGRKL